MTRVDARSWIDPRIVVGESSIEGLGLFAREPIAAGEIVARIGGAAVDTIELLRRMAEGPVSSAAVDDDLHVIQETDDPLRYGNHSCDPNTWLTDAVTIAARRPIAAGDEITSDYATMTGVESWTMVCACGSAKCRGTITGRDWQSHAFMREYGTHVSPFLIRRRTA